MKRALCIGTNYTGTDLALAGCENDGRDWAEVFRDRGYSVETLLGVNARRTRILEALDRLLAQTRRGDTLVVTLSSHGTQVPDRDGDEGDAWDEAIVPDDYTTGGVISDDVLGGYLDAWSSTRRGGTVAILADLCYSGTLTRGFMAAERPKTVTRYMPPADALAALPGRPLTRRGGTLRAVAEQTGVVLLSACAEDEVAWDAHFNGRANGAFSRAAIDALTLNRPRTWAGWHKALTRRLTLPQTPQLVVPGLPWRRYARPL